jgi:hypothetical protein
MAAISAWMTIDVVGLDNVEPDLAPDLTSLIGFVLAAYVSYALQSDEDIRTGVAQMMALKQAPSAKAIDAVMNVVIVPDAGALAVFGQAETEGNKAARDLYIMQLSKAVPVFHVSMVILLLVYYGIVYPCTGCVAWKYWVVLAATRNFGILFIFYLSMMRVASPLVFDKRLRASVVVKR